MPIERARGMDTASLIEMDRRARGEDRADAPTSVRSRTRVTSTTRTRRTVEVGPIERMMEVRMLARSRTDGTEQVHRVGANRPTVADIPRIASTRRVGRSGWKSRTRTPREHGDPTATAAVRAADRRPTIIEVTRLDSQRATRHGTTVWRP